MADPRDPSSNPQFSQAETLAGDSSAFRTSSGNTRPAKAPDFPVKDWDRYEFLRFLGQGGMGMVFHCRDRRLGREVAIKFVRSDDDRYLQRFMLEARAQARVDHEHVCKVFEVGEVEGKVFIAMQLITGASLDEVPGLSLEQKVIVLRDAALGVHEAHRVGIIHRDLKPSNIMVEQTEDGSSRTFVMDFGLAREWNQDVTETGSVLGTPAYMSPEQARGEVSRLDRRTDVYSLGATLYHALAGHPPVAGTNPLEVLNAIASVDVEPMRVKRPDIPKDLDAITLKCLEKERSKRYGSARALADDLDRFLAGESVLARPMGFWYRLQRKLWRHKQLALVGAVALVLVLVALSVSLKTRRDAGRRERLAQQFTESMARIESLARYSKLAPLHDIRPDLKAVRNHLAQLQEDMRHAGSLANGPGHYALGRGYWTLDDAEKAREHLQMAWDAGFREPRAAYALGVVLGQQFQEKLLEAEQIPDAGQRLARKKDLEATLRERALFFLRQARGSDAPSPTYLEALLAFYEGREEKALARLKSLEGDLPWFYEAPLLRGSFLQARAWKRWNQGDREGAHADFELGRQALTMAATSGRSAPEVHAALADLEHHALRMEQYGQGQVEPAFARGLAAVETALAAQPDHTPSLIHQAALYGDFADIRSTRGQKSDELAQQAVKSAAKAVSSNSTSREVWKALGMAYYQWGNARQDQNLDPTEQLAKGLQAFEAIAIGKRDFEVENVIGLIHQTWSDYEAQQGKDPSLHLSGAIAAYERATHKEPYALPAWINLGTCLQQRAAAPGAKNPELDLQAALKVLEQAHALNPKQFVPYFVRGKVLYSLALIKRDRGENSNPDLLRSMEANRQGIAINAGIPHLHNGEGLALQQLARCAWDDGKDPLPLLAQAQASFQRAITVAPKQVYGYNNLGDLLLWKARWSNGGESLRALQQADLILKKALTISPGHKGALANLGRLEAVRVETMLHEGGDPSPNLLRGEATLAKALALDPRDPDSLQYLGELRAAGARWRALHGRGERKHFEAAREAFTRALEAAPDNQEILLGLSRLYRDRAEWERSAGQDPGPSLVLGQSTLARVLKARPRWGEALALQGGLCLEEAESLTPGERASKAREAGQAIADAFALNKNLLRDWKPRADRVQRLIQATG